VLACVCVWERVHMFAWRGNANIYICMSIYIYTQTHTTPSVSLCSRASRLAGVLQFVLQCVLEYVLEYVLQCVLQSEAESDMSVVV